VSRLDNGRTHPLLAPRQIRDVLLILLGVAGLLSKRWLAESLGELIFSYLGNVTVSFAAYFWVSLAARQRLSRGALVLLALLIVDTFELTDGFGIMSNVYDRFDLLANALGVALAWCVDMVSSRIPWLSRPGT